jgi:hypothetical protein
VGVHGCERLGAERVEAVVSLGGRREGGSVGVAVTVRVTVAVTVAVAVAVAVAVLDDLHPVSLRAHATHRADDREAHGRE